jgi:hypothetical protein
MAGIPHSMKTTRVFSLMAVFLVTPLLTFGATYIEGTNGDLSNDRLFPTLFTLDIGVNTLTGTTIAGDLDYLTFNIPSGFEFQSFTLNSYTGTGTLTQSFVGIQSGTTFTVTPASATPDALLGYTHFGPAGAQGEILDNIGTGAGAMGFTPPLPAGDYTFWIQETSGTARNYSFNITVSAVPEPTVWSLCVLGIGVAGIAARRRRAAR